MRASCKKLPLDSTFIPMQVPPDAKLVGQAFLGSSSSWGSSLLVNTWQGALAQNGKRENMHCTALELQQRPELKWLRFPVAVELHEPFITFCSDTCSIRAVHVQAGQWEMPGIVMLMYYCF